MRIKYKFIINLFNLYSRTFGFFGFRTKLGAWINKDLIFAYHKTNENSYEKIYFICG
jgi:hypothetical protein